MLNPSEQESETCVECFGTSECSACLGTGKQYEKGNLLYRSSQ